MVKRYIPERGDIVWINLNPTKGHEQGGHRPAIIISPKDFNTTLNLMVVCPITSKVKGYPFEVIISLKEIQGAVLVDQMRSVDWKERNIKYMSKISYEILYEIEDLLYTILLK